MKIRPRNDKVVVEKIDGPKMTEGGIHLPDNMKNENKSMQGKVIAVGPLCDDDLSMKYVRVGQVILFGKYTGWDTEIGGRKLVVLKEEDVLAVVEE